MLLFVVGQRDGGLEKLRNMILIFFDIALIQNFQKRFPTFMKAEESDENPKESHENPFILNS